MTEQLPLREAIRVFAIWAGGLVAGSALTGLLAVPSGWVVGFDTKSPEFYSWVGELSTRIALVFGCSAVLYATWRSVRGPRGEWLRVQVGLRGGDWRSWLPATLLGGMIPTVYYGILFWMEPEARAPRTYALLEMAARIMIVSPGEEVLFRGYLFAGLQSSTGTAVAAAVVSGVFVALHAERMLMAWHAILPIVAFALVVIILRIRTDSVHPCIAAHVGFYLALFAVIGARSR